MIALSEFGREAFLVVSDKRPLVFASLLVDCDGFKLVVRTRLPEQFDCLRRVHHSPVSDPETVVN
jgi:hypothetical protein